MNQDDFTKLLDEALKPLKEGRDELRQDLQEVKHTQGQLAEDLKEVKDTQGQLAEDLKEVKDTQGQLAEDLKEVKDTQGQLAEDLKEVKDTQGQLAEDLKEVKDTQERQLLPSVVTIETTIKAYGDMYKINNSNSKKLEKRIEVLEDKSGIAPPPEFTLTDVS